MHVPSGAHLLSSARKSDGQRLSQAKRQKMAATKEARRSRRFARRAAASASTDYAAGAFSMLFHSDTDATEHYI